MVRLEELIHVSLFLENAAFHFALIFCIACANLQQLASHPHICLKLHNRLIHFYAFFFFGNSEEHDFAHS